MNKSGMKKVMMFLFVIVFSVVIQEVVDAFAVSSASARNSKYAVFRMGSDDYDPYDFLNLNKPVDPENVQKDLMDVYSIDAQREVGLPLARSRMSSNEAKNHREPWWDAFMERELGDMDAELTEDQKWIQEARDVVELKRGFAIWSKKSDKDLQRELRKTLATKSLNVPENVAMIIRAVHLEKTHTMKQIRKEHELACIELRKWMIGQKKKTKKDPLPPAKVEVSKKWLLRPPSASMGYSRIKTKPPPVVMDERSAPTYSSAEGASAFGSLSSADTGSSIGSSSSANAGSSDSKSSASSSVVTASMIHWNEPRGQLPPSMTVDYTAGSTALKTAADLRISDGQRGAFYIDSEEMFVATTLVTLQNVLAEEAAAMAEKGNSVEAKTTPVVEVPTAALIAGSGEVDSSSSYSADDDFFVVL